MPHFRKKPVVIEAIQFQAHDYGGNHDEIEAFCGPQCRTHAESVEIRTLEGTMVGLSGDWIIKGVKGEFYPCKPDVFAATYEAA